MDKRTAEQANARQLTDDQLVAAMRHMEKEWDDLRSDEDLAGGGSPGEWMVERMSELETEMRRRGLGGPGRESAREPKRRRTRVAPAATPDAEDVRGLLRDLSNPQYQLAHDDDERVARAIGTATWRPKPVTTSIDACVQALISALPRWRFRILDDVQEVILLAPGSEAIVPDGAANHRASVSAKAPTVTRAFAAAIVSAKTGVALGADEA